MSPGYPRPALIWKKQQVVVKTREGGGGGGVLTTKLGVLKRDGTKTPDRCELETGKDIGVDMAGGSRSYNPPNKPPTPHPTIACDLTIPPGGQFESRKNLLSSGDPCLWFTAASAHEAQATACDVCN